MQVSKELIQEAARLVNEGHWQEARVLAGHIRLLQAIFNIPYSRPRGSYSKKKVLD